MLIYNHSFIFILVILIILFFILGCFCSKYLLTKNNKNLQDSKELNDMINIASKVAKISFWEYCAQTGDITWSEGVYELFEIKDKSLKINYNMLLSFIPEKDSVKLNTEFENSIKEKRDYYCFHSIMTEKNNIKYLEERGRHYFDKKGRLIKTIGSVLDITKLHLANKKFMDILEYASDGVHILDKDGNVFLFSKSFAKNLGYSNEEIKKLNVTDWDSTIPKDKIKSIILNLIENPKTFETKHKRKDGTIIDVEINAKGIQLDGVKYLYASQRDITEKNILKEKLEELSKIDKLTSLYNRRVSEDFLNKLFEKYNKNKEEFSVLLIDIDYFKKVNDTFGHQTGDKVLIKITEILKNNIRENDFIGRWGGEEFLIICSCTKLDEAIKLAERLRKAIESFDFDFVKNKTISVGVSEVLPKDDLFSIIKRVDKNLYSAKRSGRNKVVFDF